MVLEQSLEEHLYSFPLTERVFYFTRLVSVRNLAKEKMILSKNSKDNQ